MCLEIEKKLMAMTFDTSTSRCKLWSHRGRRFGDLAVKAVDCRDLIKAFESR